MPRLLSLMLHDVYVGTPAESGFPGAAADRYKVTVAELDAALAELRAAWSAPPALARDGEPLAGFAVTADDGGESYFTLLADRLEALGWRGHCFVCTGMIGRPGFLSPAQLRELHRRGHVIGSHSATHPTRFSACPWPRMLDEWRRSRAVLEDLLGAEVRVASVPGGYFSTRVARSADEAGLRVLFTSEPSVRLRRVGDCTVAGRLAIRHGYRPAAVRAMARGSTAALCREWAVWNAKKAAKLALGEAYPWLGQVTARLRIF